MFLLWALRVVLLSARRLAAERRGIDAPSDALPMGSLVLRALVVLCVPLGIAIEAGPTRADCLPPPGGAPTFTATEVARIPVGPAAENISDIGCEDCGDFCELGFAFLGPDGSLYVYDLGNANLKAMRPEPSGALRLEVIPGVRTIRGGEGRVYVGAADSSGTIYLLNDRATETDKYRIFYRTHSDTAWNVADPLEAVAGPGQRVHEGQGVEGARLRILPDDALAVYFVDQRSSPSTVVARDGYPLPATQRVTLGAGAPLAGGRRATMERGTTTIIGGPAFADVHSHGEYLGSDSFGNIYFIEPCPGPPYVLKRYDVQGRVAAAVELPRRVFWKTFTDSDMLVAPDGDVFECWPAQDALRVIRWSVK